MKTFAICTAILCLSWNATPVLAADPPKEKLKVLSLEEIKTWNFEMTRKDISKIMDPEALLFATMFVVVFKPKEGGAYHVNFFSTPGKPFPYKLASVYYYPKYPDEDPHEMIISDPTPLPKAPGYPK